MSESIKQTADGSYFVTVDDKPQGFKIYGVVHHIGSGLIYDPKKPIINEVTGEVTYNHFEHECVYFLEYDRENDMEFISYYGAVVLLNRVKQEIERGLITFEQAGYEATKVCCTLVARKTSHHADRVYTDWRVQSAK